MKNRRSTPSNKQSKRWIGFAVGGVVLITLSVVGWFFYRDWREEQQAIQRQEAVEERVNDYLSALADNNYDEYITHLNDESVTQYGYTSEELSSRYETIFQGIGASQFTVDDYTISLDEETDEYRLQYTLSMETVLGHLSSQHYETVIYETEVEDGESSQSIVWHHSLILPGMEEGDSVRLSFSEPERGSIYDRHGNMLAGMGEAYEAGLYPMMLGDGEEREEQLNIISEEFNVSVNQLENLLNQAWVTEESLVPFKTVDVGNTPEVAGVMYQRTTDRLYPLGEAAAHLVGYIGEVTAEDIENNPTLASGQIVGKAGMEAVFDEQLRGRTGGQITIVDQQEELKEVVIENDEENGQSVKLTIDSDVQLELYEAFDDEPGSGAIMHPETGEMIALVSAPSYNPQLFSRGITAEQYAAYSEDEQTPFVNRYTSRYAPGSTFKIISATLLMEQDDFDPQYAHEIEGLQWSPDTDAFGNHSITRVNDAESNVDLAAALIYSDNIYFAIEALEMGTESFVNELSRYPFGEDLQMPFSMQPAQFANENEIDSETLLADTAYGQGQVLMSSIHQLVFYSTVLNSGQLTYPTLLKDDSPIQETVVSEESADLVRELLVETVADPNGTASGLSSLGYSVGAKTGTAEIAGEDGNDTNGMLYVFDADDHTYSFLGFLEGQRSGDVIDQFSPFLDELKPMISDYALQ
ncbi:MAG: penicillin-binding transpeptidase domain-containing protein [Alkalibacterium sp.]|nr:penicillin-binding transpeptidase domain-containing protein [Alkalibacterium sp.]